MNQTDNPFALPEYAREIARELLRELAEPWFAGAISVEGSSERVGVRVDWHFQGVDVQIASQEAIEELTAADQGAETLVYVHKLAMDWPSAGEFAAGLMDDLPLTYDPDDPETGTYDPPGSDGPRPPRPDWAPRPWWST